MRVFVYVLKGIFWLYLSLGASWGVWGRDPGPLSDPTGLGQPTSPPRNFFILRLYLILRASFESSEVGIKGFI